MMQREITYYLAGVVGVLLIHPTTGHADTMEWVRQLGTGQVDQSYGVSADRLGNVYIAGLTWGDLGGPQQGNGDAFVAKYDASGSLLWTKQLGTSAAESNSGVSADSLGNVFVTGITRYLAGPNAGDADAFVAKYDEAGSLLWTRQLGTTSEDQSRAVSVDGLGNVYITGFTWGELAAPVAEGASMFVAKYDGDGEQLWTRQLGTTVGYGFGVSADGLGNVYVSGATPSANDAVLVKYGAQGELLWTRNFGTSSESYGVSADKLGNVFITGYTAGVLDNSDSEDAFVAKYDAAGTLQWTRQFGTSTPDLGFGISADGLGNVYTTGWTLGNLTGSAGNRDAFVTKHDADGELLWIQQLGTRFSDEGRGIYADGFGNAYVTGLTQGDLGGPHAGGISDAFVIKFSTYQVPEPTSMALLLCTATLLGSIRRAAPFQRRRHSSRA